MHETAVKRQALISIGINPDRAGVVPPQRVTEQAQPVLAPDGVDPRQMPVDDITFDPALLAEYPTLKGDHRNAAQDKVFALYKSPKGAVNGSERNKVLWRKIGEWLVVERRKRETGGIVTEKVKATSEQRDIAALVAASGLGVSDLVEALQLLEAKKASDDRQD